MKDKNTDTGVLIMGTHRELITSGKFDEKFKRALLDYYGYGFKKLKSYDKPHQKTVSDDWFRLTRVISTDYLEWSENHNKVMFASTDSQSMAENPFHRVYRFCSHKPLVYPAYFFHTMAALSEKFEVRGGYDSLDIGIDSTLRLEDLDAAGKGYKTSDLMQIIPEISDEEEDDEGGDGEVTGPGNYHLADHLDIINRAIGDELKSFADGRKIRFRYSKSSVINKESKTGKEHIASPYCVHSYKDVLYLLARQEGMNSLRTYRLDHMSSIEILDQQSEALELQESIQERFGAVRATEQHNNALKALTERLDELASYGFVSRNQKQRTWRRSVGDRWWSLQGLTMGKLLETGNEVDENFEIHFLNALDFYSKNYLFGEIGTFLQDRSLKDEESPIRMKHDYFMQALNDFNILDLLYAISEKKWCMIKYSHGIEEDKTELLCYPLQIRISNMGGREYLMYYEPFKRSFTSLRIEFIDSIEYFDEEKVEAALTKSQWALTPEMKKSDLANVESSLEYVWGASTTLKTENNAITRVTPHRVDLTLAYDPATEFYIPARAKRESRFGNVEEKDKKIHFSIDVSNEAEMRPWVRSFYTRILSCEGMDSDTFTLEKDIERVARIILQENLEKPSPNDIPPRNPWRIPNEVRKALGNGKKARWHDFLFNEVFSIYYYIMGDVVVQLASVDKEGKYTRDEIKEIIESAYDKYFIRTGTETEALLFKELIAFLTDGGFLTPTVKHVKKYIKSGVVVDEGEVPAYSCQYWCEPDTEMYRDIVPISKIEFCWLKTILSDEEGRIKLFLSEQEISAINELLEAEAPDIPVLPMDKVMYFDRFHVPEKNSQQEEKYVGPLLAAINSRKTVRMKYRSQKNILRSKEYRPILLELSKRNNEFQCYAQDCETGEIQTLNIPRIEDIVQTETHFNYTQALSAFNEDRKANTKSVEIEFYNVLNAVDRILMEFSPWKKLCTYDPETGLYRLTIYYQSADERDLVVRLLGYGPAIHFRDRENDIYLEVQKRLEAQMSLMHARTVVTETETERGDSH